MHNLPILQREDQDAETALAALCERYWYPLYVYVWRRVADVAEAQDLTQEPLRIEVIVMRIALGFCVLLCLAILGFGIYAEYHSQHGEIFVALGICRDTDEARRGVETSKAETDAELFLRESRQELSRTPNLDGTWTVVIGRERLLGLLGIEVICAREDAAGHVSGGSVKGQCWSWREARQKHASENDKP